MKKVWIGVLAICTVYFIATFVLPLKKIHSFERSILEDQVYVIQMELYPLSNDRDADPAKVQKLKNELFWFQLEIQRKKFFVDYMMGFLFLLSLGFVAASNWFGTSKKLHMGGVKDLPPTEKYVDDFSFQRAKMSGFSSKEEALSWLGGEKFQFCEYCGGKNFPSKNSNPDQVQFCTFYKEVPRGSNDLRIVLGSVWYVVPASEVQCSKCSKIVKRM